MRLGILGGTFDPPHVGHLLAATDALERLSLDRILLVPNAVQPIKGAAQASAADRLRMVELLVGDDSRFCVDPVEVNRNGLSFTVDTLEDVARRFPGAALFLLAGDDVLTSFPEWSRPERVLELATLVLMTRNASSSAGDAGARGSKGARESQVPQGAIRVASRVVDVSSSEIRERVRSGLPLTGFVNEKIERFIVERGLYKTTIA